MAPRKGGAVEFFERVAAGEEDLFQNAATDAEASLSAAQNFRFEAPGTLLERDRYLHEFRQCIYHYLRGKASTQVIEVEEPRVSSVNDNIYFPENYAGIFHHINL